jgi:hypothetical protein
MSANTVRDALQHDGEHAGLDDGMGVLDQLAGGIDVLALHPVAAHGVERLRGQPEVAHHRDLGVDDAADRLRPLAPPSSLTASAPFPHEPTGVDHGVTGAGVIAHPRHVHHHQAVGLGPLDRGAVDDHEIGGHLQGGVEAVDGVGDRVAHQDHVDPRLRDDRSGGMVVGGDHRQLGTTLAGTDTGNGDLCMDVAHVELLSPHHVGLGDQQPVFEHPAAVDRAELAELAEGVAGVLPAQVADEHDVLLVALGEPGELEHEAPGHLGTTRRDPRSVLRDRAAGGEDRHQQAGDDPLSHLNQGMPPTTRTRPTR